MRHGFVRSSLVVLVIGSLFACERTDATSAPASLPSTPATGQYDSATTVTLTLLDANGNLYATVQVPGTVAAGSYTVAAAVGNAASTSLGSITVGAPSSVAPASITPSSGAHSKSGKGQHTSDGDNTDTITQ